jgi:hypothetical protein
MGNSEKIKRTAEDYAGVTADLKNGKDSWWRYLIIRGRYKAALGKIILNEFLDWTNERPVEFTEKDVLIAIHQAWWREFETYEYDGHRSDPSGYFVQDILEGCMRHDKRLKRREGVYMRDDLYRKRLLETLKNRLG